MGRPPYDDPTPPTQRAPAPGELPPDAPATVEEVRTLRRWLWVVGAWAAAASIVAIIALVTGGDDSGDSASTRSDVAQLEESLTGRLDNVEQRLDEAPSAEDLERLDNRLKEVENQVEEAQDGAPSSEDLDQLGQRTDDLERRVEELEAGPPPEGESP
jgi:hypothetical protein